jgi:hypothetical protein
LNSVTGWLVDLWQNSNAKVAVVTAIIGALIQLGRWIAMPRGKIVWGISNNEHFVLPAQPPAQPNPINVRTRQIFIQNVGRAVAEDVEVTINYPPQNWYVFPPVVQTTMPTAQDRFLRLRADKLNKREHFIIGMFDARGELPFVVAVRWKGGVAKPVNIGPRQIFNRWTERYVVLTFYLGILAQIFIVLWIAFLIF